MLGANDYKYNDNLINKNHPKLFPFGRVSMARESRRFWNRFILQLTRTQFQGTCLPWFLVASVWVCPSTIVFGPSVTGRISKFMPILCSELLVYIGTPALTSRGFLEADFVKVAEYFDEAVKLALKIKANSEGS